MTPGVILEPQEPWRPGASLVSCGRVTIMRSSSLLIENRSIEQFALEILLFFQYGGELFMSLKSKKTLALVISLPII